MGTVKKSYDSEDHAARSNPPDSPGPSSSTAVDRAALLSRNPWAARMLSALGTGTSGSEGAHVEPGSGFTGTRPCRGNLISDGAHAGGPSPSVPNLAPGQPFYGLLNLVQDPGTSYSHGLALMVARFGNVEIMRAFKARGWQKEAASENS